MSDQKNKIVLIIAGEASADLHGSNLVRAMKRLDPKISFLGIGGEKMENEGVKILFSSSDMAVVGLTEIFSRIPYIFKAHRQLKLILKETHPDLLILIDYPEFNLFLARSAKRFNVPVLYYISPQVWAWRKGRIKKIVRRVDRMATILPFEAALYRDSGLNVEYVGHPLLDAVSKTVNRREAITEMGLTGGRPILGLLPGSRREEIENLLPLMVQAVDILSSGYRDLKCVLPIASTISPDLVQSMISKSSVDIKISQEDIYKTMATCDLAMVTSGTATLETAIMGIPMVVVYRASPLTFWIAKKVVKVPFICIVNLVAGEEVVPELMQDEVTPQRLAQEAMTILEDGRKNENMIKKLKMVVERLGSGGASARTAGMALEMMERQVDGENHTDC
ncbi:lipid-A-disaccharide synthase [bacterium]|nr:lipid-A-disaccharide synthase [bacterium]